MTVDEDLLYGLEELKPAENAIVDEGYDPGLITDDAEEQYRIVYMGKDARPKDGNGRFLRNSEPGYTTSGVESDSEYDSGLVTDGTAGISRVIYVDKQVQTEETDSANRANFHKEPATEFDITSADEKTEREGLIPKETNDGNSQFNVTVSDDDTSTVSAASRSTLRNKVVIIKKVSQQVDESEYEATTADEQPTAATRKKAEVLPKRPEKTVPNDKNAIRKSTVSLADKHDKPPDEASDHYDADYESYDNDDSDDLDLYEPAEISLTDTLICVGFGYALVYG